MMQLKRFGSAAGMMIVVLLSMGCWAFAIDISASHAVLMDQDTEKIIFEKSAEERSLIASTTKIMTALVVCERCNVKDRVQIGKEAVGIEGSSMYLKEGEILTVQDLLYGLMLHSGNDAAVALAIYCGGTVEDFVAIMNEEAAEIGLANTHYANPNGLDSEENYSTAVDLAKLTAYAMKNELFQSIVSTKQIKIGDRQLTNHNKLLWQCEGADGVKTGYTKAAGRILVSSAVRDGRRLICVTINDGNDWQDHARLLDYGFESMEYTEIVAQEEEIGNREVFGGAAQYCSVSAAESFSYPLLPGETVHVSVDRMPAPYAPVFAGTAAGTATVFIDGAAVKKIPLCWSASVVTEEKAEEPSLWDKIWR